MKINIHSYIPKTNVEGAGTRFAIWVQGCSIHCKGCANSHMWNFDGGTTYDIQDFTNIINSYKNEIEGITFLGGEPLEQIEAVTEICKYSQKNNLSTIVFTGFEYETLKDKQNFQELIKYVDILIDGKFEENKTDYTRAWVGSSNQNYYFFTKRYDESVIKRYKNKFEIRISPDNKVIATGMGDYKKIKKLIK